MKPVSERAGTLRTVLLAIGWYKALVCLLAFLASLGVAEWVIPQQIFDGTGMVLVRYLAWFCLFVAVVNLWAAREPERCRSVLKLDVIFFGLSAVSPLLNLLLAGSLFWLWWVAIIPDLVMTVVSAWGLLATRQSP